MANAKVIYFDGRQAVNLGAADKSILLEQYPDAAWKFLMGGDTGSDAAVKRLYQEVAVMFRGVDLRSKGVAGIPFSIYRGKTEIDTSADYQNKLGFWPVPRKTLRLLEMAMTMLGRAYLSKLKNKSGKVLGLRYLIPTTVDYKADETNGLTGFTRSVGAGTKELAADDIIYFWPEDYTVEIGPPETSPAYAALAAGGVLISFDEFAAAFFSRGAVKVTLLTVDGTPNADERKRLETWWADIVNGIKNAFSAKVIQAGKVTPVVIGEGLSELDDSTLAEAKRQEIAIALGIPQSMLFANAANYATAQQDELNFLNQTVVPECEFIAEVLNTQLLAPLGYRIEFHPETMDAFKADEKERASAFASYAGAGLPKSLVAEMLGLDLPGGWEYADLDDKPEAPPAPVLPAAVEPPQGEAPAPEAQTPQPALEAPEQQALTVAALSDLARWQRKAGKRLKEHGSAVCLFESQHIPADVADRVTAGLAEAKTAEDIAAVFANPGALYARKAQAEPDIAPLVAALWGAVAAVKGTADA